MDDEESGESEFTEEQGEHIPGDMNKNFVDAIFNTDERIDLVLRSWRGEVQEKNGSGYIWIKKNRELAGERFINKTEGAMRVIINDSNIISRKNDKECKNILYRANEAFIFDMLNEPTIHHRDYRTLAKSFEHNIELFLGMVEFGHGAKVATNISTGTNLNNVDKKNQGVMGWLGLGGGRT